MNGWCRKIWLCCVLFPLVVFSEDITTMSGKSYKNASITRTTPVSITVAHDTGISTISYSDLPVDVRVKYGYNQEKESRYKEELRLQEAERIARATEASEVRKKAEAERKKRAEIDLEKKKLEKAELARKRQLAELHKRATVEMPEENPKIGMFGMIKDVLIVQVINKSEVLVERQWYTAEVIPSGCFLNGRAPEAYLNSYLIWIQGIPTDGLVDNGRLSPARPLIFTETKTYTTANKTSKTVILARPLTEAEIISMK